MSKLAELLRDEKWRLWNLYQVKPKIGQPVHFVPNVMQEKFLYDIHWKNIIVKSRQIGFSTLTAVLFLDRMLFVPHTKAGIIDFSLPDAAEKLNKIKFAYESIGKSLGGQAGEEMNALIHRMVPLTKCNEKTMEWANGSRIRVGTTLRGDTLQLLHVSEFGKIANEPGDRDRDIIDGALPAAEEALVIFESTHEGGKVGEHYKMATDALENPEPRREDFKLQFYAWWQDPKCRIEHSTPRPDDIQRRYYAELEERGIVLDDAQKAFHLAKWKRHGFAVFKEYPSTLEDAWRAPLSGAYYGEQMASLRAKGRIHEFEHERYPVHCFWDIGQSDSTAIWAVQLVGPEIWWIDWYENEGETPAHYAGVVREWASRYPIATHFLPHDAGYATSVGWSYQKALKDCGVTNTVVLPRTTDISLGINELRELLKRSRFHVRCAGTRIVDGEEKVGGVGHLELYRKHENKAGATLRERPVHDEHSHSADAARYFAEAYALGMVGREFTAKPRRPRRGGDTILAV